MEILKTKYTSIWLQEISIELQKITNNEQTTKTVNIQTIEKYIVFDSIATRNNLIKKRTLYTIKAKLDKFVKSLWWKIIHPWVIIILPWKTFNTIRDMAQNLEEEINK